jgi:hypothetical protein
MLAGSIQNLMFGIAPSNYITLAALALIFTIVVILGCGIPAWRGG